MSLDGYFLSNDPAEPKKWAFPSGSRIAPNGFLVVWLDGDVAEGTVEAPHAGFRPAARDGVIVLSQVRDGGILTVDFLRYTGVPAGMSFGHFPDAWVHADDVLPRATPGSPNGSIAEPERVWINEWFASNDGSVRDPADLDADDGFELYNPGSADVDLSGWLLTDTTANPAKFRIPSGYRVPAGGFLWVWADEEAGQNQPSRPDLHVSFRLAAGGEEIALYRPDGTLMDHVIFGPQTDGVSEGRRPDGAVGTNYVSFASPTPGRTNASLPPVNPDIAGVQRRVDGSLWVRFNSVPGATYRLRSKDDLNQSNWTPSATVVTAQGPVTEMSWPADEGSQRFIQVERVP